MYECIFVAQMPSSKNESIIVILIVFVTSSPMENVVFDIQFNSI